MIQLYLNIQENFERFLGRTLSFVHTIIIIYRLEFFTSALLDGLSLEFEWQQVS